MVIQVTEALSSLHRLHVIHRDILFGNIERSLASNMKPADFGISRMCNHTLRIN
jgi:serine/threonine protein kinase